MSAIAPDPRADRRPSNGAADAPTAQAFARSWNTVGEGSVYTRAQFDDWLAPVDPRTLQGQTVLELGFGNGSLLLHAAAYGPSRLCGIELGDTLAQTRRNLRHVPAQVLDLRQGDLTTADLGLFDFVYCIGVLHHLEHPEAGFEAVLRHTRPGGRFHCWVYAEEGNAAVIRVVDPIRRVACRLPWWVTKYAVALPLAVPFYSYAKTVRALVEHGGPALQNALRALPLVDYSRWVARRDFAFFHHVAFDQLVTPRTRYIPRSVVERWLTDSRIERASVYVELRNGNSWKFGGRRSAQ